ncbi:MAG TPA: pilin [Burkholderiales bacterium]|jgi:type IV pilus assembly protein PilA|nr:pilin [Burkholderiales bacterium]HEX2651082.1 pilin [Burkholderiales bacterium]
MRGFTLLELMIVVAIVGVLAMMAVPTYFGYVTRAQVSEATDLLWAAKVPLAEYYVNNGKWPAAPGDVMSTTSGRYTAAVSYLGTPDDAPPGQVTLMATMSYLGISAEIRGGTLLLETSDGGSAWNCTAGGDRPIARDYLPGACR